MKKLYDLALYYYCYIPITYRGWKEFVHNYLWLQKNKDKLP